MTTAELAPINASLEKLMARVTLIEKRFPRNRIVNINEGHVHRTISSPPPFGGGGTLDQAYDFGGVGAGRTINTTDGAVLLQTTEADAAPNLDLRRALADISRSILEIGVNSDANPYLSILTSGAHQYGAGGASVVDLETLRTAAGVFTVRVPGGAAATLRVNNIGAQTTATARVTFIDGLIVQDAINYAAATATITAGGAVVVTAPWMQVAANGGPGADDLDIIDMVTGGTISAAEGDVVFVSAQSGNTITVRDKATSGAGAGGIQTPGGTSITLDAPEKLVAFFRKDASNFYACPLFDTGGAAGAPTDARYFTLGANVTLTNELSISETDESTLDAGVDIHFKWAEANPRIFKIANETGGGGSIELRIVGPSDVAGSVLSLYRTGDTDPRVRIGGASDAAIYLGGGSGVVDVTVYRAAADVLATDDNLRLASAGKVIQDSGGNTRIGLSTSTPHITLTGDVQLTAHVGVATAPTTTRTFYVSETVTGTSGNYEAGEFNLNYTPNAAGSIGYGLFGGVVMGGIAGSTVTGARALDFSVTGSAAAPSGNMTFTDIIGINILAKAQISAGGANTVTVTNLMSARFQIQPTRIVSGTCTVTNGVTLWIRTPNHSGTSAITNNISTRIEDYTTFSGTTPTLNYLLEVGGGTGATGAATTTSGLFRIMGNFTAAANVTPMWISEGATPTLRQLKTFDPGNAGANFTAGQLVCVLV